MSAAALRTASRVLALVGVLLVVIGARVVAASRAELHRGDEHRARGDLRAAVLHYRRAARWYAPGSPYDRIALERLRALALAAEAQDDREEALATWRAVRGAIRSARGLSTPHARRLREADQRIEALTAGSGPASPTGPLPERPRLLWTLVLLLGGVTWTAGAFAFVRRALDDQDRLLPDRARRWGTVILVGLGLFALGLALA